MPDIRQRILDILTSDEGLVLMEITDMRATVIGPATKAQEDEVLRRCKETRNPFATIDVDGKSCTVIRRPVSL